MYVLSSRKHIDILQPDLASYIDQEVHSVQTRQIRKEHAIEDIDELEIGNFDVFVNYLVRPERILLLICGLTIVVFSSCSSQSIRSGLRH
jgi:hypothetical protein